MTVLDAPSIPQAFHGASADASHRRTARSRLWKLVRPREGKIVFLASAVPFTAFAVLMSMVRHMAFSDALTRLNNAESVIYSYDPHLAAIGFVYGPVPSAIEVPFLLLAKIWPNLQVYNVIGAVMTALFAAGTMATVVATARELKLPRFARYGLAAAPGLHPIYLVYASNGMAEGINLFFLAVATRFVLRWLDRDQGRDIDLFWASLALGAAYLTRIEAIGSGLAVIILISIVGFARASGSLVRRRQEAAMCGALVGLPFLFIVGVWAALCKVIVGQFIPALAGGLGSDVQATISQQVGTTLGAGANYASLATRLEYLGRQVFGMSPLLVPALIAMVAFLVVRTDWRGMVPIATFGGSMSVDVVQLIQGNSFANLRYFMLCIPLTVYGLMLFATLPSDRLRPRRRPGRTRNRLGRRYGVLVHLTSLIALALAVSLPAAGAHLVRTTNLAVQERPWLYAGLYGTTKTALGSDVNTFDESRAAAAYVDRGHYRPGSVLIDAGAASALLAGAVKRNRFLTNADLTWLAAVADPARFGVDYMMVSDGTGLAGDALDRAYPRLFIEGGGIADKVADFGSWRLYKLRNGATTGRNPDGSDRVPVGGFNG